MKVKKNCFYCFYFTIEEFTLEQVKRCAEHWLDAEKCTNWRPFNIFTKKKKRNKKIIWVEQH